VQRQNVLQDFDLAYQNYLQLKAYLGEGTQFYMTLQDSLQKFKSKCYDFTFARKTEKQDLVVAIQTKSVPQSQQSNLFANNIAGPATTTPQASYQLLQMGRGGTLQQHQQHQQQPIVFTQGVPILAGGRGTPILVQQQPQIVQQHPQQIRMTPSIGGQGFQPVVLVQQQPQPQHQAVILNPGAPPPYTQSQAQRSVFPENPYGNFTPSGNLGPTGY